MPQEFNSYDQSNVTNARPELSAEPVDKRPLIIGIVVSLIIIVIFLGIGWFLFINPVAAARLRDIFIIYLGLGAFLVILLLIALIVITTYLVLKVNDLVQLLDREIKPMLAKMQGTLSTVRGTTTFVSEQAIQPMITTFSSVTAVRTIVRSLFRND